MLHVLAEHGGGRDLFLVDVGDVFQQRCRHAMLKFNGLLSVPLLKLGLELACFVLEGEKSGIRVLVLVLQDEPRTSSLLQTGEVVDRVLDLVVRRGVGG